MFSFAVSIFLVPVLVRIYTFRIYTVSSGEDSGVKTQVP